MSLFCLISWLYLHYALDIMYLFVLESHDLIQDAVIVGIVFHELLQVQLILHQLPILIHNIGSVGVLGCEDFLADVEYRFSQSFERVPLLVVLFLLVKADKASNEGYDVIELLEWILQECLVQLADELVEVDELDEFEDGVLLVLHLGGVELNRPEVSHPGDELNQILYLFVVHKILQIVQVLELDCNLQPIPHEILNDEPSLHYAHLTGPRNMLLRILMVELTYWLSALGGLVGILFHKCVTDIVDAHAIFANYW